MIWRTVSNSWLVFQHPVGLCSTYPREIEQTKLEGNLGVKRLKTPALREENVTKKDKDLTDLTSNYNK